MIYSFLKELSKKSDKHQLLWVYILASFDDSGCVNLEIKEIKKTFNYQRSTFYRILSFGIDFFNDVENDSAYIKDNVLHITINVVQKPKFSNKKPEINNSIFIMEVLDYLNDKTNKNFTNKNKQNVSLINARIKDGFTLDDFKKVIDIKCEKWLNSDMADYLRPVTLFSLKMESYLNETINVKKDVSERFTNTQSAVDKAKEIDWFNKG